jgi:cyanate permease
VIARTSLTTERAAAHDLLQTRNRQMRQLVAVLGCILWFALNGLLWYARPSPITWLLGSAVLGIVFFAAFFWYVTRNSDSHQKWGPP